MESIEERAEKIAVLCKDCKKDVYNRCPDCALLERYNGYIHGATDQQEIFDSLPKIKAWLTCDSNNNILIWTQDKPIKIGYSWAHSIPCDGVFPIKRKDIPEGCNPQWTDEEPIEVELIINLNKGE